MANEQRGRAAEGREGCDDADRVGVRRTHRGRDGRKLTYLTDEEFKAHADYMAETRASINAVKVRQTPATTSPCTPRPTETPQQEQATAADRVEKVRADVQRYMNGVFDLEDDESVADTSPRSSGRTWAGDGPDGWPCVLCSPGQRTIGCQHGHQVADAGNASCRRPRLGNLLPQ